MPQIGGRGCLLSATTASSGIFCQEDNLLSPLVDQPTIKDPWSSFCGDSMKTSRKMLLKKMLFHGETKR